MEGDAMVAHERLLALRSVLVRLAGVGQTHSNQVITKRNWQIFGGQSRQGL